MNGLIFLLGPLAFNRSPGPRDPHPHPHPLGAASNAYHHTEKATRNRLETAWKSNVEHGSRKDLMNFLVESLHWAAGVSLNSYAK